MMRGMQPFRFGAMVSAATTAREFADAVREVSDSGFSTLTLPDHFDDQLAPLVALSVAAGLSSTLRLGTMVLDNDYRHPLVLAKEAATLDLLSEGRLELGIGAGWMRTDYDTSGIGYDSPGVRVDRFEEGLQVLRGLWSGEPFSLQGKHYTITEATGTPLPVQPGGPRLVIGGGGRRVLGIAARQADIVGINPNLQAGAVTVQAGSDLTPEATARKVAWVREAAGDRFASLELSSLVGMALVTDDAASVAGGMAQVFGVSPEEALQVPVILAGTVDAICDELQRRREVWGISYIVLDKGSWRAMAPVVQRLAGT
jgi:probable F420-dependent oxidoreductase